MEHTEYQPGSMVKPLDFAVRLIRLPLLLGTILFVPLAVLALSGRGDITVDGVITEPVTITFEDGRYVGVGADGRIRVFGNFPTAGREGETFSEGMVVRTEIGVTREDTDARVVVVASAGLLIALTWIGLNALRGIVAATLDRRPFADQNPRRLRHLGFALLAGAVTAAISSWLLTRSIDSDIGVRISYGGIPLVVALVGVAVLALAELFAEAARLRELEEATI